jgi:hypothetical protein
MPLVTHLSYKARLLYFRCVGFCFARAVKWRASHFSVGVVSQSHFGGSSWWKRNYFDTFRLVACTSSLLEGKMNFISRRTSIDIWALV